MINQKVTITNLRKAIWRVLRIEQDNLQDLLNRYCQRPPDKAADYADGVKYETLKKNIAFFKNVLKDNK